MKTKAKINFIEFVRPNCYWPAPYSLEQAFGVMQWMVATGKSLPEREDERGRWGISNVECLLSMKPTCVNSYAIDPIHSVQDLRRRFHYALLSSYESLRVERWREKYGIFVTGTRWIQFPHEGSWGSGVGGQEVDRLLGATGTLTTQLNQYHAGAVEIYSAPVSISGRGFSFVLNYGYDGSRWFHTLAESENGESFGQTFRRAEAAFAALRAPAKEAA